MCDHNDRTRYEAAGNMNGENEISKAEDRLYRTMSLVSVICFGCLAFCAAFAIFSILKKVV